MRKNVDEQQDGHRRMHVCRYLLIPLGLDLCGGVLLNPTAVILLWYDALVMVSVACNDALLLFWPLNKSEVCSLMF